MRGRWVQIGLWSCLLLIPLTGWCQEPLRHHADSEQHSETDDDGNSVSKRAPLKLTRAGLGTEKSGARSDKTLPKRSTWTTAGSLVIVVALIVGCGYLMKRQRGAASGVLADDIIQVLGRKTLDQRTSIQLVRCGSKILVLSSSTQQGTRTLSEITDPAEVESITQQCRRALGRASTRPQFSPPPHVTDGLDMSSPESSGTSLESVVNGFRVPAHGGRSNA